MLFILSIHPPIHPTTHINLYLSIHPPTHSSTHPSIHPSIHPKCVHSTPLCQCAELIPPMAPYPYYSLMGQEDWGVRAGGEVSGHPRTFSQSTSPEAGELEVIQDSGSLESGWGAGLSSPRAGSHSGSISHQLCDFPPGSLRAWEDWILYPMSTSVDTVILILQGCMGSIPILQRRKLRWGVAG